MPAAPLPSGASQDLVEALRRFKRQALHAARLSLAHPVHDETVEFSVPPPADFQHLLDVLREDARVNS